MYKLDPSRVYLEIVDKFPKNSTCSTQTQIAKITQKKKLNPTSSTKIKRALTSPKKKNKHKHSISLLFP